ncbi:hypothetical protein V6N13_009176 [Hibiscus sabdariffa]
MIWIRIIWLGDLNYRINLTDDKVRDLISKKEWSKLIERDQLVQELQKGRTFDGWSEGVINFAPTYKYELNSDKYYGEDLKAGRRTPAWCDRILFYGKGMRQLRYSRAELKLSDHRPVTAVCTAEVEVFCPRRLQRAMLSPILILNTDSFFLPQGVDGHESHGSYQRNEVILAVRVSSLILIWGKRESS